MLASVGEKKPSAELRVGCCGFPQVLDRYPRTFPVVADDDLGRLLELAQSRPAGYVFFNNISMLENARRFQQLCSAG
jgi:hypothetical protein